MHTKGKLEIITRKDDSYDSKFYEYHIISYPYGKEAGPQRITEVSSKFDAEEIVHRWNAFEEDGLVTELLEALESADLSLIECAKYLMGTGPVPDSEAIALTMIQVKAAIKQAESQ